MNLSIRTRITVAFTMVFAALLVLFTGVVYFFLSSGLERKLKEDSLHDIGVLIEDLYEGWDHEMEELHEESDEFRLLIRVLDKDGRVISSVGNGPTDTWPVELSVLKNTSNGPQWSDLEIDNDSYLVLSEQVFPPGKDFHYVQVANSRNDMNWIKNQFIYCVNVGTPIVLILAVFVGSFFSRRALAPVEEIRRRAQQIKSANLDEFLTYDGPQDELYRLTETLNDLLARLKTSFDQMRQFIADASHELRIPLTGMRGTLEVALRQERKPEEYKKAIESAYGESERMSDLVRDLLSLARADAGEIELDKKPVNIESFIQNVIEQGVSLIGDRNVKLLTGPVVAGMAIFDEVRIHQLILNLIENGFRYNKPGGTVTVSADLRPGRFIVTIADTGIGIAPEDQQKIFKRFYRVDKARSRGEGGTGLGLAIAKAIAEAHQGTLSVQSDPGLGSTFTLTLPH